MTYQPNDATLGIIGPSPLGVTSPVTTKNFRDFQRHVGALESASRASYFAGHAASHAFMNGVQRIVFQGIEADASPQDYVRALQGLLMCGVELHAVILPGRADEETHHAIAGAFTSYCEHRGVDITTHPLMLWLDAPDRVPVADVVRRAQAIPSEQIQLAYPWIETTSPTRRSAERLPPSSLIAPLYLGCIEQLKGVHEPDSAPTEPDQNALARAGCGVLVPKGRRRLVHLASPLPWGSRRGVGGHRSVEAAVEDALNEACTDLMDGAREGEQL